MSEQVMLGLKVKRFKTKDLVVKKSESDGILEKICYFGLWQHFHDDWNEEEDDGSIEVESAKEKNCLLEKRENLEGDHNQDTGERACSSLEKVLKKFSGFGSFEVPPCKVPSLLPGRAPRS